MDYVPDNDVSFIFEDNIAPNDEFGLSRKTKDMQYNRFGLSLIELCCTYGMHTLNGHLFNDTEGNFTCIANDGASIVDYMIAATHLFQFFTDFGINDMDWSVHFPLFCKINFTLNEKNNHSLKSNVHLETWHKFKWKPELKEAYIDTFHETFSKLEAELNIRPQNSLFTFLPKFINIVKLSAGRMVNRKREKIFVSQPSWFDKECLLAKRGTFRALRQFRITNNRFHLNQYKNLRNRFEMVCHNKKQSQLKQRRNKLICSRKDARQFWKILKEGNASRRQNETGISSDEWFNYLKNLLNMRNDSTGSKNVVLFHDDRHVLDSSQLNIPINAA